MKLRTLFPSEKSARADDIRNELRLIGLRLQHPIDETERDGLIRQRAGLEATLGALALGARGGSVRSEAKARAARKNGTKGGRPNGSA